MVVGISDKTSLSLVIVPGISRGFSGLLFLLEVKVSRAGVSEVSSSPQIWP